MNEGTIESLLTQYGKTAPRLKPEDIDNCIVSEQYYQFPGTLLIVCCLTLRNGFTVTGESACASPHTFIEDIGKRIARDNARDKIWVLEGYLLKERLSNGGN